MAQRQFDNFSAHKNWALDHLDFKHDWILIVDADERVTPDLAREIAALVTGSPPHHGYYLARQNWFAGVWIRHGGWYPDYNLRLLRRGRGRYEARLVHEHILLDGPPGISKIRSSIMITRASSAILSATTSIPAWRRWRPTGR